MEIVWLSKGKPKTLIYKEKEYRSGISKAQVNTLDVHKTIISGDDVENHEYHGGVDRVICVYPYEHYQFWEKTYQTSLPKAAFGENMTVSRMTEEIVCVGDMYQIGETILQVSQGRFPCSTINKHTNIPTLLARIVEKGYTGYFFRVVKEGRISENDRIHLIEKHPFQLSIAKIHHTYFHDKQNLKLMEKMILLDELSKEWKDRVKKLYSQQQQIK
ncbi:MOSC domain-containing protein [Bacillus weihaiensis]|uniref:Sulfurase n=1 Tax=Bacillus weihaiensis TaxID=1547283 RepID=A0A1L3MTB9_9BACI|nr:MOSC domain-containing protein [Bacillus weihaiensis]APH05583.1 sulfurase [Bacillus weihaiensis]